MSPASPAPSAARVSTTGAQHPRQDLTVAGACPALKAQSPETRGLFLTSGHPRRAWERSDSLDTNKSLLRLLQLLVAMLTNPNRCDTGKSPSV